MPMDGLTRIMVRTELTIASWFVSVFSQSITRRLKRFSDATLTAGGAPRDIGRARTMIVGWFDVGYPAERLRKAGSFSGGIPELADLTKYYWSFNDLAS
jgi:hypothetical protein